MTRVVKMLDGKYEARLYSERIVLYDAYDRLTSEPADYPLECWQKQAIRMLGKWLKIECDNQEGLISEAEDKLAELQQDRQELLAGAAPRLEIGDYVLATKYLDGHSADPWFVGFYGGVDDAGSTRILDVSGMTICRKDFQRVSKISAQVGLKLVKDSLEMPDDYSLWDYIRDAST